VRLTFKEYVLTHVNLQTDGWLSERSAKVYEVSTETLFLGRQDAMQRQTLVPLRGFMVGRIPNGEGTRLLEVAAGTGRFATFVKVGFLPCPTVFGSDGLQGNLGVCFDVTMTPYCLQ
jgi:ubiquinone/menaquinone biosynthesis C-methylase UbiE